MRDSLIPEYIPLVDMILTDLHIYERQLAGCLLLQPTQTIEAMQRMKVEPEIDSDVCKFWEKIKIILPITGMPEDIRLKNIFTDLLSNNHELFWKWLDELGPVEEYESPDRVIMDLKAVRLVRSWAEYSQKRKLLHKKFRGWV